ncbi:MAG: RlmE family RNA methyltransferase [Alphaproteobacteria bacterium]|nr:RlmE family RNA methyltransferase [Alphaproteobacteria bacterium]
MRPPRRQPGRPLGGRVLSQGRRPSSVRWLQRQLDDPYVAEARRQGYRSRAAFKLIEIDDRYRLLRPGQAVLDLGAAPGGWTQVAVERVRAGKSGQGRVVALDREAMAGVEGAIVLAGDVSAPETLALIEAALGGPAGLVLADMAPATTGHGATDHLRIVVLAESALEVAIQVLAPGGSFVVKLFQGGAQGDLQARLRAAFTTLHTVKPPASRKQSAEVYLVARGFRPPELGKMEP